jgi:integrase
MSLKVPRLSKTRHGVYYVRAIFFDENGKRHLKQHSLQTKNSAVAKFLALQFCLKLAKTERQFMDVWDKKHGASSKEIAAALAALDRPVPAISAKFKEDFVESKSPAAAPSEADLYNALKVTTPLGSIDFDLSNPADSAFAERFLAQALAAGPAAPITPAPHIATPQIQATPSTTLSQALEQHFAEEARRGHVTKTLNEKKGVFADFLGFYGDIPLEDITLERIGMPGGWRDMEYKATNGKNSEKKRGGNTLEKRRGYLSKFFSWAKAAGRYKRENPMSQKMATNKEIAEEQQSWAEFTDLDIKALFNPKYKTQMNKPDFYWLPLMALFSGARLGELARLELSTFEQVDGVKSYRIKEGKNKDSRRTVPLHPQLLNLGLWDYVQALKAQGETFLMPHRPQDPAGTKKADRRHHPEKMMGRMWSLWVKECGIQEQGKVFHSFRSTVVTDLHNQDASVAAIQRSVGHTSPAMAGVHGQTYVRGIALQNLQTAVDMIKYPQVDFEAIKLTDPTFAGFFAAEEAKKNDPRAAVRAEAEARHLKSKAEREERNRDKRKKRVMDN